MQGKKGLLAGLALVVVLAGVGGYFGLVYYSTYSLKAKVDTFIEEMKDDAEVSYKGLTTRPFAGALDISDMTITPKDKSGKVTIKEITLYGKSGAGLTAEPKGVLLKNIEFTAAKNMDFPILINEAEVSDMVMDGKVCTQSFTQIRGITIDAKTLKEKERGDFKEVFNTDKLLVDAAFNHSYIPGKKELEEKILISSKGLGEISLNFRFGNADYAKFADKNWKKEKDPLQLLSLGMEMSIMNLELGLKNSALVQNVMKVAAKKQGVEPQALTQNLVQQVDQAKQLMPMLGSLPPQVEKSLLAAVDAVKKFLQDPKSLKLTIAPAKPVVIGSLVGAANNPGKLLQELNVSLTAN